MKKKTSDDNQLNFLKDATERMPETQAVIERAISDIQIFVSNKDPLDLMTRAYWDALTIYTASKGNVESHDYIMSMRVLEYIQSMIACTQLNNDYDSCDENDWSKLKKAIDTVINQTMVFLFQRSAQQQLVNQDVFSAERAIAWDMAIFNKMHIRGVRYLYHELPFLEDFLTPHDGIIYALWGIHISDILTGIKSIIYKLTRQVFDNKFQLKKLLVEFNGDITQIPAFIKKNPKMEQKINSLCDNTFGSEIFNLHKSTNWPDNFLKDFSWEPGQNKSFLDQTTPYPGWPLKNLPIFERPFLHIDGQYYCFELLCFLDNFYRVVEKTIIKKQSNYRETWNKIQKSISENLPFSLLKRILPDAEVIQNLFYKVSGEKQRRECDGIIIFEDVLFIIEVKGGKFSFDPTIMTFDDYEKSLQSLIKNPIDQASRFLEHLEKERNIDIYNEKGKILKQINVDTFNLKLKLGISIESFTHLTSQAHKLSGVELQEKTVKDYWSIALDDLRIYADLFENSPLIFLHFIEQRLRAANDPKQQFEDELSHIGLYFEFNMYTSDLDKQTKRFDRIIKQGFSDSIDEYYNQLIIDPEHAQKPCQKISPHLLRILELLQSSNSKHKHQISKAILDKNGEARKRLHDIILEISLLPINRYVSVCADNLFVTRDYNNTIVNKNRIDTAISSALSRGHGTCIVLRATFDLNGNIEDIDFLYFDMRNLLISEKLSHESNAKNLVDSYLANVGRHQVGRNQPCPCGSGKKYKKCCL